MFIPLQVAGNTTANLNHHPLVLCYLLKNIPYYHLTNYHQCLKS